MRDFVTWIEPRGTGRNRRYRARTQLPDGQRGPSKTFVVKAEAQGWCDRMATEWRENRFIDPRSGDILFGEWAPQVLRLQVDNAPSSRRKKEGQYKTWLQPTFGNHRLSEIRQAAVRLWVAEMTEEGCAPTSIAFRLGLLSQILLAAVEDQRLVRNPCKGVKAPRAEFERRFLTMQQVEALVGKIGAYHRVLILVAAASGLRFSELAALRGAHVDPLRRQVTVAANVQGAGRHRRIVPYAKTRAGLRTVDLPRWAMEPLVEQMKLRGIGPSDLVFTASRGGNLLYSSFRDRHWLPAVGAAGLGQLTFHALRHTAVSLWIASGASPKEVQVAAGHASIQITYDIYGHLFPNAGRAMADRLDEMWAAREESNIVALRRAE